MEAEDPGAQIAVANIGFSRGAEQAAGFARLLHERGIQDWTGMRVTRDEFGRERIEYTKPPLVPPGQTAQALGLFDPVGTGRPRDNDRRPPPSVISGFQITAKDERRNLFQSTSIIDQGVSDGGRFLGVTVAGAHSDIGGAYHRDGLAIRSGNLMIDYLNSLSDVPYLQKTAEPANPALNVIHRSEEGMFFYRTSVFDRDGERGNVEALAPGAVCRAVPDCRNPEPRDETLANDFRFRRVPIADPPTTADTARTAGRQSLTSHPLHAQAVDAVRRMETSLGRDFDGNSERLAASMALLARQNGFTRIDEVALSNRTATSAAGEHVFVIEGDPYSPTHRHARMTTQAAIATPAADTLGQLDTLARHDAEQSQARSETTAPAREHEVRQHALIP